MASGKILLAEIEDLITCLKCSICYENFKEPHLLPCGHTFCLLCLQKFASEANVVCLECRPKRDWSIPESGIASFQENFVVNSLLEVTMEQSEKYYCCDICKGNKDKDIRDIPSATQYCKECCQLHCHDCYETHKMSKRAKDHSYITTGEYVSQNEKASDEFRKSIESSFSELEEYASKCEDELAQLISEKESVLRAAEATVMQIMSGVSNEEKLSMLRNVSLGKDKKLKDLEARKCDLVMFLAMYKIYKVYYDSVNFELLNSSRLREIKTTITRLKSFYTSSAEKETTRKLEESNAFEKEGNQKTEKDKISGYISTANFSNDYFQDFLLSKMDNSGDLLMDDEAYMMVREIAKEPQLQRENAKKCWNLVLPYIMQNIKMWNPSVMKPRNLSVLFCPIEHELRQSKSSEVRKAFYPISRLDIISYIINEADCFVREEVLKMLARFNLAIPLVIPNIHERNQFIVTLPMLKSTVIKLESNQTGRVGTRPHCPIEEENTLQNFLFSSPFNMAVALRLGKNTIGKSTILNQLMKKTFMFSSRNEPGARHGPPRTLDGTVEIVVLISETCSDTTWSDLSLDFYEQNEDKVAILANLHGNALLHTETLKYLNDLGSSFIVFRMPDATDDQWDHLVSIIGDQRTSCIYVDQDKGINTIQTNMLADYETQNTVISQLIQSLQVANGRNSVAVQKPLKFVESFCSEEAKKIVNFVKKHGIAKVKESMTGFFAEGKECRQNEIIHSLLELFFSHFELPKTERKQFMIDLERDLNELSVGSLLEAQETTLKKGKEIGEHDKGMPISASPKYSDSIGLQLGQEHFFRLTGEIYRRKEKNKIGQVATEIAPDRYADLLLNGQAIELLDGDLNQIQFPWIKAIFERVSQKEPNLKIFVISVIGLQSSGKSTLLNALFACRFRVGAGRCTKGLFMRMLYLEKDLAQELKFGAIILIDTEGLCSSEKLNDPSSSHHDRMMATFAMSISNLTIVNILGETMNEIVEILQIAIVAMTRFHGVNIKPDIIVVQHLQERNAGMNKTANIRFSEAINKSFQLVEEKTSELSVSCLECINELRKKLENRGENFRQFGAFKDGAGLNATPSEGYHNDVVKQFETVLRIAKSDYTHTFDYWSKTLLKTCWKSVQEENFALIFKNVKDMADFFYFEKQISKVVDHLEIAFRFHRERFTNLINDAIKEVISSRQNEKESLESLRADKMKEFKAELENIPYSCKDCMKCDEFVRKKNQLLEECKRNKIQQDAGKSASEYISRLQKTSLEIATEIFESSAIRQGCCWEFHEIIEREVLKQFEATKPKLSKENKKETVEEIWNMLKAKATEKDAQCCSEDLTTRFKEALHIHYVQTSVFKDICTKIETEITFESLCETSLKQRVGRSLREFFNQTPEEELPLEVSQLHCVCKELDDYVRLVLENRQPDFTAVGINFDEILISQVKTEFPDIIKKNESDFRKDISPDLKQNLLLYSLQQLKNELEPLQEKWDKMNKPSEILESQKEHYIKLIEAKQSDEIESACMMLAKDLWNTLQKTAMGKVNAAKIKAFKDIAWTNDIQKVRARYFTDLAEQVKNGSKDKALDHFQNPEKSIKNWLKDVVDSSPTVKHEEIIYAKLMKSELGRLQDTLQSCKNKMDVEEVVKKYLRSDDAIIYRQIIDKVEDTDFDFFIQITIKALCHCTGESVDKLEFPSIAENREVQAILGCTKRCYFCGALCWGCTNHAQFFSAEHYSCHQPRGLKGKIRKKAKPLKSVACHEMTWKDQIADLLDKPSESMIWQKTFKRMHKDWKFDKFSSILGRLTAESYEKLMLWFFKELHEDLSSRCNAKPANEADIKLEKFQSLDIDEILREIGNDI